MTEQEPVYEVPDPAQARSVLEGRYEEAASMLARKARAALESWKSRSTSKVLFLPHVSLADAG